MKHLFKNFGKHKIAVLIVFCLLVLQAYFDMTLPGITSKLIDTGIQNRGIEHIVPEKITGSDYNSAAFWMDDEQLQLWSDAYSQTGTADSNEILERTASTDMLDELDNKLLDPIVIAYQVSKMESGATDFEDSGMTMTPGMDYKTLAKDKIKEMKEATGEQTLKAMALAYSGDCMEKAGMDVDQIQKDYMFKRGFIMLAMSIAMIFIATGTSFISSRTGASIGRDLRSGVFSNVMAFSNAEIDKFKSSSLITRATNDIQQVQMVSTMMLRMIMLAPIMGTWGIIKVAETKAHMSFVIITAVIMLVLIIGLIMMIAMPKFKKMQTLVDNVNAVSREILTGLPVIRAFCREKTEEERFDAANTTLMKTQLFVNRVMAVMEPAMMMMLFGTTIAVTWIGSKRIDAGTLQVGALTAFITYSMMIIMSFLMLSMMFVLLPRAGVAADRINEVITTHSSINDAENATVLDNCKGSIEFKDVSFTYPDADEPVISGISFTAKPGETTAFVGSTGSGKSTLIKLIPRFYDVTEGQILIDGKDVREYTLESLRESIGYVPQKGVLFSGTIDSNLRFGAEDASEEEIKRAAEISQSTEFIEDKEDKYDNHIAQGGTNVSGGQKQRLSIGRALAKKAKVLIFDDSFSALDMKTDATLRKELAKYEADSTKLIVAQRVGTILHAEQIVVLDEGHIVGIGTHEELLDNCEVYSEIAKSQLSNMDLEAMA